VKAGKSYIDTGTPSGYRTALRQLARVGVQEDAPPDREGELTECPRVTRELDVTAGQDVPCLVVPYRHGRPFGKP
jgi:hypothetical protein